jgi:DNA-binding transcriptional MerR regulator
MAQQEPTRKHTGGPPSLRDIPDKLYFRIGEVSEFCDLPAHVLRFWQDKFPQINPHKAGNGQRLYRRRDVEMILRIKSLLYDEGYTITGAIQAFKSELRATKDPQLGLDGVAQTVAVSHLEALQKELRDLHALLSRPPAAKSAVHPIRALRAAAKLPPPTPFPKPQRPQPIDRPDRPIQPERHDRPNPRKTLTLLDSLFEDLPPEA